MIKHTFYLLNKYYNFYFIVAEKHLKSNSKNIFGSEVAQNVFKQDVTALQLQTIRQKSTDVFGFHYKELYLSLVVEFGCTFNRRQDIQNNTKYFMS